MPTANNPSSRHTSLEYYYQVLVENIKDYAIYMLTPEGIVASWNAGARHFKGYMANEIIGRHFSCFYAPEDQAAGMPAKSLQIALAEGKFEAEGWRMRKDGSKFWAHVVIDPVHNEAGELIGFAKITRDNTEQRKTAEMLAEAKAALVQSQKMEALGKLTGGIAHDFNNLLQGIMGNLDLMRLRIALGQTSELGRHLDAAISCTKRSAALTHRLLAFARRQTLLSKPVDANWLTQSMTDLLQRTVGPDIEIELKLQEGLWWTHCDQNQLENALLNLVINARDAMPEGGHVIVQTANIPAKKIAATDLHLQPGDYVRLSVTDTGIGMAPDVIEHVFEPFFTTKPFGEGTGLGLSMVHGFVKQSGGHVTIESAVGKGTTINLFFQKQAAVSDAPATDSAPEALPTKDNQRLTVLVVDDEQTVRTMLSEMLQQFGYETLTATDGHDGLRILESIPQIDLLVTDVGLPGGMNGRQLANAARQRHPDLKILFITGYAEQSAIGNDALPSGMQILAKPFEMDKFAVTVQDMINNSQNLSRMDFRT